MAHSNSNFRFLLLSWVSSIQGRIERPRFRIANFEWINWARGSWRGILTDDALWHSRNSYETHEHVFFASVLFSYGKNEWNWTQASVNHWGSFDEYAQRETTYDHSCHFGITCKCGYISGQWLCVNEWEKLVISCAIVADVWRCSD